MLAASGDARGFLAVKKGSPLYKKAKDIHGR